MSYFYQIKNHISISIIFLSVQCSFPKIPTLKSSSSINACTESIDPQIFGQEYASLVEGVTLLQKKTYDAHNLDTKLFVSTENLENRKTLLVHLKPLSYREGQKLISFSADVEIKDENRWAPPDYAEIKLGIKPLHCSNKPCTITWISHKDCTNSCTPSPACHKAIGEFNSSKSYLEYEKLPNFFDFYSLPACYTKEQESKNNLIIIKARACYSEERTNKAACTPWKISEDKTVFDLYRSDPQDTTESKKIADYLISLKESDQKMLKSCQENLLPIIKRINKYPELARKSPVSKKEQQTIALLAILLKRNPESLARICSGMNYKALINDFKAMNATSSEALLADSNNPCQVPLSVPTPTPTPTPSPTPAPSPTDDTSKTQTGVNINVDVGVDSKTPPAQPSTVIIQNKETTSGSSALLLMGGLVTLGSVGYLAEKRFNHANTEGIDPKKTSGTAEQEAKESSQKTRSTIKRRKMKLALAGGILTLMIGGLIYQNSQQNTQTEIATFLTSDKKKTRKDCTKMEDPYQAFYCAIEKTSLTLENEAKTRDEIKKNFFISP